MSEKKHEIALEINQILLGLQLQLAWLVLSAYTFDSNAKKKRRAFKMQFEFSEVKDFGDRSFQTCVYPQ